MVPVYVRLPESRFFDDLPKICHCAQWRAACCRQRQRHAIVSTYVKCAGAIYHQRSFAYVLTKHDAGCQQLEWIASVDLVTIHQQHVK